LVAAFGEVDTLMSLKIDRPIASTRQEPRWSWISGEVVEVFHDNEINVLSY
jgi:hypothetical protein